MTMTSVLPPGIVDAPPARDVFVFPASAAQQRLWLAADADPTGAAYNITRAVTLHGAVDLGALRQAASALIDRHELLRTVFVRRDGALRQMVLPSPGPWLDVHDLRGDPPASRERRRAALLAEEAARRFDLARGPLVRLVLVRLDDERSALCLNLHHIICDAWSLSVLVREFTTAYRAAAAGRAIDLGPAPLQYADFAVWQQETAGGSGADDALAFWTRELAGLPVLPLPADMVRSGASSGRGVRSAVHLDAGVTARVREVARSGKTTPFVVMLAAYAAFLQRWTGASDIPIGTPTTGRDRVELENVVGPFVNTIVLRIAIDHTATFRDVVATARGVMLAAMRYADAPFDAVVAAMPRARTSASAALFRTMFAMQSIDVADTAGVLHGEATPIKTTAAKHDLTVVALDAPQELVLTAEYTQDLFLEGTIEHALASFAIFLKSIVADPDVPVARARWLAGHERPAAFLEGPATGCLRDRSIYELFAQAAAAHPDSPAIENSGRVISYRQLRQCANDVAAELKSRGVQRGDRVALVLGRGPAFVAAALGVVKIGAVYIPIDPAYPPARVQCILADAAPGTIIYERDVARAIERQAVDVPATPLGGLDPAYIIYTSGSTGEPKGVVVPHRAIARLVTDSDYVRIGAADRVAHASNVAFDAATFEIWGALLNGATLVVIDAEAVASPALLARALVDTRLSILFVTTAVFNQVARDAPEAFAPLRALLFGGEASSPAAIARVVQAGKPSLLLHVYGPTECTTFATAFPVERVDPRMPTVPIGRPIARTRARVLDAHLQPVPQGVVGELFLGGDGLAIGYHERDALTAERFIPDPFAQGERLYRTGDRCRITAEGAIQFVERADRQVKLRGFRIEPAEVERVLAADAGVAQVVVDIEGSGDDRRLIAAVVLEPGCTATGEDLRRFAAARLPSFMVPAAIRVTSEIPLTAHGKIDRRRLAAALVAEPDGPRRPAPPRDPLEAELVRIWEDALGVSPVGITDDFFALGGHSLLAASMLDRVEELFGRRVPISTLLCEPTIEGLASAFWRDETASARTITVMRAAGSRPPFFYIHGDINGGGVYCRRLLRGLNSAQSFYALAPPAGGDLRTAPSIESMAEHYIRLIREVCPTGPIALGGYCHGALASYEIARRLSGARTITTVVMVHPSRVAPELSPLARLVNVYCRVRGKSERERVAVSVRAIEFLGVLARTPAAQLASWLAAKVRRTVRPAATSRPAAAGAPTPAERHDPETWSAIMHAVQAFVPRQYDGRLALLVAPEPGDPTRGWRKAARHPNVVEVPGDHRTCVTTYVDDLAAALDRELAEAAG